ncbi:YggT family protein [Enterococcus faecium]|nr:YggT family protein [Enterococcus faecium]
MSWFRFIPPIFGIDFSPILALLVLELCANGLVFLETLMLGVI